ncbi:MAG: sensor domain-containing diguanylate cyclase, partial [Dehalococcoidia bacterium]|nr:sensor domain-containing diguanylate cyclase [Dehalococcoidia bacterium]
MDQSLTTGALKFPLGQRVRSLSFGLPPAGWALITYVAVFSAFNWLAPADLEGRKAIIDAGQIVTATCAAFLCAAGARSASDSRGRRSWMLFAAAFAVSALGEALWAYFEIFMGEELPSPSVADIAYGLMYPLAFVALMLQAPRSETRLGKITSSLDALLFGLGSGALIWHFVLVPALLANDDPLLALVSSFYPLGDVLLVLALSSLLLRLPLDRVPRYALPLVGAFVIMIFSDTAYTVLVLNGEYQTGNPIDCTWSWSYALVGLAAMMFRIQSVKKDQGNTLDTMNLGATRFIRMLLPYLALPMAGIIVFVTFNSTEDLASTPVYVALGTAVTLFVLTLLRQFLVLLENNRLSLALAALSRDLESRVSKRTEELAERTTQLESLNRVATQISLCLTPDEVQSMGLRLASEAMGYYASAAWLANSEGQFVLASHHGLSDGSVRTLLELAERSPVFAQGLRTEAPRLLSWSELGLEHPLEIQAGKPGDGLLVLPLHSRRVTLGALTLAGRRDGALTTGNLSLGRAVGASLGVGLENANHFEELRRLADRDSVTNLLNHRAIHRRIEEEIKRSERSGHEFSVLMTDLDGFKLFNDTYGHPEGDRVLRDVAALLAENTREFDVLARYGGDEFIALLPETGQAQARVVAERVRSSLSGRPYASHDGGNIPIRMSFGIATYPQDARGCQRLVGSADANLYLSKQHGGDLITANETEGREVIPKLGHFGVLDGLVTAVDNKDHYTR